jgi:hypothetical protein
VAPAPTEPDPTAESAEVVARLERIAARQASAQARMRQAAAEQRAAGEEGPAEEGAEESAQGASEAGATTASSPHDILKGKAADVIFGAQARRTPVGGDTPPEPGTTDDVIEGTVTGSGPAPGSSLTQRPATPEAAGSENPALTERPRSPRMSGRPDRRALPATDEAGQAGKGADPSDDQEGDA